MVRLMATMIGIWLHVELNTSCAPTLRTFNNYEINDTYFGSIGMRGGALQGRKKKNVASAKNRKKEG